LYNIQNREVVLAHNKKQHASSLGKTIKKEGITLVAEHKGQVVGVIGVTLHRHEEHSLLRVKVSAELDISVKETMRGYGVGTKLIQAAEVWAQKHGAERMMLHTYVGNERAINFYKKYNQFEVIGLVLAKPLKNLKKTA